MSRRSFIERARKSRTIVMRMWFFLLAIPLLILAKPYWAHHIVGDFLIEGAGFVFIVAGVFGRLWAYLHICGRKSKELVMSGPYALCRNPLYFFSLVMIVGIGLIFENFLLFLVILAGFAASHGLTILQEERKLAQAFGESFENYRRNVPRLFPSLRNLRRLRGETLLIDTGLVRKHLLESMSYLLILPLAECLERLHALGVLPTVW